MISGADMQKFLAMMFISDRKHEICYIDILDTKTVVILINSCMNGTG